MKRYKQNLHSCWCASLSGSPQELCDCPASEEIKDNVYKCNICGKTYGVEQGLKVHQWKEKKKPYFHNDLLVKKEE